MEPVLTVTQLNGRAHDMLSNAKGLHDIWVSGEISNLTRSSAGHYYFTLKDESSEIRGVLFSRARSRMDFEPTSNMKVQAFGSLDVYVPRGTYQFVIDTMKKSGLGDLFIRFEQLKKRLEAEGLFAAEHKKPLPRYPRSIGVVTSETGAVIHDIITTSSTRFPADILLAHSMVQGEGAARTIVAGIVLLNTIGVDVIIVARGGGSLEDLWPFNEEMVARAIYRSKIPVVSAVGHETDFTIADFVADVRAPTPTGAAAIILRDRKEIRSQLDSLMDTAGRCLRNVTDRMRHRFEIAYAKLSLDSALRDMDMRMMDLDNLMARAENALSNSLRPVEARLQYIDSRLSPRSALHDIEMKLNRLDIVMTRIGNIVTSGLAVDSADLSEASARLTALNPMKVLDRGYSIVSDASGRAISCIDDVTPG